MNKWQRHLRLSLLAIILFLLFIVCQAITTSLEVALPVLSYQMHMSFTTIGIINLALNLVLFIPLWSLLLWAIFGWRRPEITTGPVLQAQRSFPAWQPQPGQPPYQAQPFPSPQQPQQPQSPPASASPHNQTPQ